MPELRFYRIFISHAWKYDEDYYRLIKMLDESSNFKYMNYSVPKHDPLDANNTEKLKEQLRLQIRPVEIVLILAGMYVCYSNWIQFEIDYAKSLQKSIVGVKPWGSEKIPTEVQIASNEIVGWNTSTIVEAIRKWA